MGYLIEGHPENGQALTQSLYVPAPGKKKKKAILSYASKSPKSVNYYDFFLFYLNQFGKNIILTAHSDSQFLQECQA